MTSDSDTRKQHEAASLADVSARLRDAATDLDKFGSNYESEELRAIAKRLDDRVFHLSRLAS